MNYVTINGAVRRPGVYELENGLNLKGLIINSDGLTGDAYMGEATIVRKNKDFSEDYITVDLDLDRVAKARGAVPSLRHDRDYS